MGASTRPREKLGPGQADVRCPGALFGGCCCLGRINVHFRLPRFGGGGNEVWVMGLMGRWGTSEIPGSRGEEG